MLRSVTLDWGGPGSGPVDAEGLARWAFKVHKAGMMPAGGVWGGGGITSTAIVGSVAALGTRVDSSAFRRYEMPDLAMDVDGAVSRIGGMAARAIRYHCGRGERPEYGQNLRTRYEPKWKHWEERDPATGQPVPSAVETIRLYDRNRHPVVAYCPVLLVDPPELIEAQRAEYSLWWQGIEQLGYAMAAKVPELVALQAPAEPWRRPRKYPLASCENI